MNRRELIQGLAWSAAGSALATQQAEAASHQQILTLLGGAQGGSRTPHRVPIGTRFGTPGTTFVNNPAAAGNINQNVGNTFVNNTGRTLNSWQVTSALWKQNNVDSFQIYAILIDTGGSAYTTATVSFSGGSGTGAAATAVLTGGVVTAIYITNSGSGYLSGETPTVTITGDGTGATAHVSLMDGGGEIGVPYNVSIEATGFEYPLGTYTQFLYSSASSVAFNINTNAVSDVLNLAVPPGGVYRIKTFERKITAPTLTPVKSANTLASVTITTAGLNLLAPSYSCSITGGAGTGAAATAYTYNGSICAVVVTNAGSGYTGTPTILLNAFQPRQDVVSNLTNDTSSASSTNQSILVSSAQASQSPLIGPVLLSAIPVGGSLKSAGGVGDSILTGFGGGDNLGDSIGGYGWLARSLGRLNIGFCKIAAPGYYASSFVIRNTKQTALLVASGVKTVVFCLGVNDIQRGDSFNTIQANILSAVTTLTNAGFRVLIATIGPCASSTDNWLTVVNQTPSAGFGPSSICQQLNDWIRTTPSPSVGFVDYDAMIGSAPNAGTFKVIPNCNNGLTSGALGLHPTDEGHAVIVGCTGALSITAAGSGYATPPTLAFSNMGIPTATANFSGGVGTSFTVNDNGGRVYSFPPPIRVRALGGVGSGMTGTAVLDGSGMLTSITMNAAGSLYSSGALVSIGGALPPQGSCTVSGGAITAVSLDFCGSDLTAAPTVSLSGGGGSGGAISATLLQAIQASMFT